MSVVFSVIRNYFYNYQIVLNMKWFSFITVITKFILGMLDFSHTLDIL